MSIVMKRSELLFCYDVTDANPNGDPLDENKPRIDEETKINIVTDVRLKRTVRDYLCEYKGYNGTEGRDIFVRELYIDNNPDKGIQDGKTRASNFKNNAEEVLKQCIDVRMFGCVIPLEKDSITFTGPVQFKMGRSLHKVELKHIKGTGAFAAKPGAHQKTFREEFVLPYSFIAFHGIINETAAQETNLSEADIEELLSALWYGTKNLISRSKFGQMPRFLLKVTYREKGFFIGDLEKKIILTGYENDYKIRSVGDFKLDITELVSTFSSGKVDSVEYKKCVDLALNQEIPDTWKELAI